MVVVKNNRKFSCIYSNKLSIRFLLNVWMGIMEDRFIGLVIF